MNTSVTIEQQMQVHPSIGAIQIARTVRAGLSA